MPTRLWLSCHALLIIVLVRPNFYSAGPQASTSQIRPCSTSFGAKDILAIMTSYSVMHFRFVFMKNKRDDNDIGAWSHWAMQSSLDARILQTRTTIRIILVKFSQYTGSKHDNRSPDNIAITNINTHTCIFQFWARLTEIGTRGNQRCIIFRSVPMLFKGRSFSSFWLNQRHFILMKNAERM